MPREIKTVQEIDAFARAGRVACNNGLTLPYVSDAYPFPQMKKRKMQMKLLARCNIITSGASRCFAMLRERSALQAPPLRTRIRQVVLCAAKTV